MKPQASRSAKRILIVDDHHDLRIIFSQALKKDGYDVVVAKDGVEGFERIEQQRRGLGCISQKSTQKKMN